MNRQWIIGLTLAAAVSATAARAEVVNLSAALSGQNEVPPVQSQGIGSASATLDTSSNALQWEVRVQGLSGPISAAHFHCPATTNQNAPISLPIAGAGAESPLRGSTTVNPAQMDNLLNGRCYINVHTALHPPGEVRGQVIRP